MRYSAREKTDTKLLTASIIASLYGLLLIISAVKSSDSKMNIVVQSIAIAIGIFCMLVVSRMDYQVLLTLNKAVFVLYILLLVLVLFIGTGESVGTVGWISLGPVNIQPSEFAKVGFILTFACHIASVQDKINNFKTVLLLLLHILAPLGLILLQPDYGTGMVFIFISIVMLFYAGLKLRYFFIAGGTFAVASPLLWFFVLDEFQKNRIRVFLSPESDPMGSGYNVIQSKLAVGAGGFFGKGLFKGTQIQMDFLPGKHTDFIFAVAGEELGFLGCVAIILLMGFIIFRIIKGANQVKTSAGGLICMGVAAMLIFQAFENIGMSIGIMPVTGIPLPFFSYGGSSIITTFLAMGLVLAILRQKENF
ncbi:MAG: rod shape-determining protein RodA [Clostridia bacterium]|nr:rod shape-determining protein RodA [Clostridia bacterium]